MRQQIATFLFIILLSPMLFTSAWMQMHRWQVRQSLKTLLLIETENPNLVWLKLSTQDAAQLHWEDEHEFAWRGTLYDLVETKTTSDGLYLHCWPDHTETGLGQQLDHLLGQSSDPPQQHRQLSLQDFLKSLPPFSLAAQCSGKSFTEGNKHSLLCLFVSRFATSPPSPPPQHSA